MRHGHLGMMWRLTFYAINDVLGFFSKQLQFHLLKRHSYFKTMIINCGEW